MDILSVVGKRKRLLQWRSLTLDLEQQCLRVGEVDVPASRAEFGLMRLLVSRRNVPMSKCAIMSALFGAGHGRDLRQVDIFVARLRKALSVFGLDDAIATLSGRGYAVLDDAQRADLLDFTSPQAGRTPAFAAA